MMGPSTQTKAARRRISLALRGRKKTREHRRRIAESIKLWHAARRAAKLAAALPATAEVTQ